MDRIIHSGIEAFKTQVYEKTFNGKSVTEWKNLLSGRSVSQIEQALKTDLDIT